MCESFSPGIIVLPFALMTWVLSPRCDSTSFASPTATKRPSLIATAAADRLPPSVVIFAFVMTVSALMFSLLECLDARFETIHRDSILTCARLLEWSIPGRWFPGHREPSCMRTQRRYRKRHNES